MKILIAGALLFMTLSATVLDLENSFHMDDGVNERRLNEDADSIIADLKEFIAKSTVKVLKKDGSESIESILSGACVLKENNQALNATANVEELVTKKPDSHDSKDDCEICIQVQCNDEGCHMDLKRKSHLFQVHHLESIWDKGKPAAKNGQVFNSNFNLGKYIYDFCNQKDELDQLPVGKADGNGKFEADSTKINDEIVETLYNKIKETIKAFDTTDASSSTKKKNFLFRPEAIDTMKTISIKVNLLDPEVNVVDGVWTTSVGSLQITTGDSLHVSHVHFTPIFFTLVAKHGLAPELFIKCIYFETVLVYSFINEDTVVSYTYNAVHEAIKRFYWINHFIHSNIEVNESNTTKAAPVKHTLNCNKVFGVFEHFGNQDHIKFTISKSNATIPKLPEYNHNTTTNHIDINCKVDSTTEEKLLHFVSCSEINVEPVLGLKMIRVIFGAFKHSDDANFPRIMWQADFLEGSLYDMVSFLKAFQDESFKYMKTHCKLDDLLAEIALQKEVVPNAKKTEKAPAKKESQEPVQPKEEINPKKEANGENEEEPPQKNLENIPESEETEEQKIAREKKEEEQKRKKAEAEAEAEKNQEPKIENEAPKSELEIPQKTIEEMIEEYKKLPEDQFNNLAENPGDLNENQKAAIDAIFKERNKDQGTPLP
jgi:hypothetical protein